MLWELVVRGVVEAPQEMREPLVEMVEMEEV